MKIFQIVPDTQKNSTTVSMLKLVPNATIHNLQEDSTKFDTDNWLSNLEGSSSTNLAKYEKMILCVTLSDSHEMLSRVLSVSQNFLLE